MSSNNNLRSNKKMKLDNKGSKRKKYTEYDSCDKCKRVKSDTYYCYIHNEKEICDIYMCSGIHSIVNQQNSYIN